MSVPSAIRPIPTTSGVALLFNAAVVALPFIIFLVHEIFTTPSFAAQPLPQRVPLSPSGFITSAVHNLSSLIAQGTFAPSNSLFVPFLATQGFSNGSKGYGFGFWAVQDDYDFISDLYLCVSLGQAGLLNTGGGGVHLYVVEGRLGAGTVYILESSFAVPVWNANTERPLAYVNASLQVATAGAADKARVLELRDGDGSLAWSLFIGDNAAFMELQDSGNLVILDSANRTVWQSFQNPSDTLVVAQNFSEGMSLTSSDSVFSVAMELQGLAFYLINSSQTGTRGINHINNASFWILPAIPASNNNESGPVSGLINPRSFAYGGTFCRFDEHLNDADLVRLDRDGRLRFYTVSQYSLDPITTLDALQCVDNLGSFMPSPQSIWGACDTPMECGPMGLCRPNVSQPCTCPAAGASTTVPVFEQIDQGDANKGCRLTSNLHPNFCASNGSTLRDFLEVINTATIFQFSSEILNISNPVSTVDNCKKTCLLDCNCMGVIFNYKQSLCFPMTDHRLSLLQVAGHTNLSYTAFLKVVATTPLAHVAAEPVNHRSITVVVATTCGVVAVLIAALTFYGCHRGIIKRRGYTSENQELGMALSSLPTKFSSKELHKATQSFSNLVGKGGMGSVYAGALPDGKPIAVKKLDIIFKGEKSKVFLAEVATMGKTSHFNIVQLVGFCWETDQQMLVYEYMEKGSLDAWLFKPGKDKFLDWATRFKVALGIAKGLAYLHEGCSQPILHLDIKPQNILLDTNFEPKLADFGLARFMPRDTSLVVTVARGTPGYMAPEMSSSSAPLSKKCDIYSLGMVLLEVVGGRKSIDLALLMATLNAATAGEEHELLHEQGNVMSTRRAIEILEEEEWHFPSLAAKRCAEGRKMELVDKQLQGAFCEEEASRMIEVALWCIQENSSLRPSAGTVVKWLEGSSVPLKNAPFSSVAHYQSRVKSNIRQASIPLLAEDAGENRPHLAGPTLATKSG